MEGPFLFLLLLVGAVSAAPHIYTKCQVQADCTDSNFPICTHIGSDETLTTASTTPPLSYIGVYVRCETDCDCDLHESEVVAEATKSLLKQRLHSLPACNLIC